MKLLLDLQGAQNQSRHRGIGRYTLGVTRALLERAAPEHDIRLLLNARFGEAADALIAKLGCHVLPDRRLVLEVPEGIRAQPGGNPWLRQAAARTMRYAIEGQTVDIAWYSSVLEGYNDDALLPDAPPTGIASVSTLYDLIPLHDMDAYLGHPRVRQWYEQSIEMLRRSDMLLAISEWVRRDAIQRLGLPSERVINIGAAVDSRFAPPEQDPSASAELRQRYGITRSFVLYNGGLESRKNVASLIRAFATLPLLLRSTHQLVIVGRAVQEEMAPLLRAMREAQLPASSVIYTGFIPDSDLIRLYAECALFVFPSLLEGFGLPPLEAMACGAPVITSHAASLPEVIGRQDALFDPRRVDSIAERMTSVLGDANLAAELRRYGRTRAAGFSWDAVAARALDAMQALKDERACTGRSLPSESDLIEDLKAIKGKPRDEDFAAIASTVVSARPRSTAHRWLVDVSSIAEKDIRTGVQRLVRNTLTHWLRSPPEGIRIEPVRFARGRFRHARRYAHELLGAVDTSLSEDAVEAANGDVFVGLDWAIDTIAAAEPQLREWHRRGVNLQFVVNDLLPITLPDMFHPYSRGRFEDWLRRVASMADRLICISRATADDLCRWLAATALPFQFQRTPAIAHSPPGVDTSFSDKASLPRPQLIAAMEHRRTFLMVGTIEPRKGYDQALDACELLWNTGVDCNLVIVGHFGWLMEKFRARLENHAEHRRRLIWIHDADDSELDAIYRHSTALLAASWGEGYGLPLIEAARRGLPVIARDLPVFREVMGDRAIYFNAPEAAQLADALRRWLNTPDRQYSAAALPWPSSKDSAEQLANVINYPG